MAPQPRPGPGGALAARLSYPDAPLIAAALLTAALLGVLLPQSTLLGIGLVLGLAYAVLAFRNLALALVLWMPLVFLEYLAGLATGLLGATALLAAAWLGNLGGLPDGVVATLRERRRLLTLVIALYLWLLLSLAWAAHPFGGFDAMLQWTLGVLALFITVTTLSSARHARWIAVAFVGGATVSVLFGLAANGLDASQTAIDTATRQEGRLQGGAGDPNVLAAGLVPAMLLAAGLAVGSRRRGHKLLLVLAMAILAVGLAATESRGGLIAGLVALLAALVVFKRHRPYVAAVVAILLGVAALWFAVSPGAWHRVTTFDEGGNGRSDLWRVGWRMAGDYPAVGVGLGNFRFEAGDYTRQPGVLREVHLIVERPHVAHNAYLQLLSETGVVGLGLFLAVALGFMGTARAAARRFDAAGEAGLAALARAVLVGIIGSLAASVFLSNGFDRRTWVLFALAVVLSGLANRMREPQWQDALPGSVNDFPASGTNRQS